MTNRDSERKNTIGITNANKEISTARISCEETFNIKLSLTASPDIVSNPTDIVLLLDRSQSMAGSPLANLKNGVKKFIDIIADATGGTQDGQIGAGSRIGIVSFSNTAVAEGNAAIFPDPVINIDCGEVLVTEPCPQPLDITIDGCEDSLVFDSGDLMMQSAGRILQLSVTLKNVCPGKRVALAAIVTEVDSEGLEYKRGFKTMTIPAHNRNRCRDVKIDCIKFVLPEDLSVGENQDGSSICGDRQFKASFIAHYIDNDFQCCDVVL